MRFDGQVVLVTGASSGIGLSCAQRLLALGASVALVDCNPPSPELVEQLAATARIELVSADVGGAGEMERAVSRVVQRFGRLDAAINCAGIKGDLGPLVDQHDDALDALYAVNMRGIFLAMKYQLRQMMRARSGAIVNVSSIFGLRSAIDFSLYSATKHGVIGLTKGAALEVAGSGIRVNAVAPGPVATPFLGHDLSEAERFGPVVPMHRFADADEIAAAALWLCCSEASFVTGEVLSVDGGLSAQSKQGRP
ncbi:MAG: oxidoreductase [Bradyrhizobium sp.]|nr:oxidoreductase [Bradyrhizobium sp.]